MIVRMLKAGVRNDLSAMVRSLTAQ
eukprot:COSAG05_NODE_20707_length_277_cov_0.870787_1_plen_25_part_01